MNHEISNSRDLFGPGQGAAIKDLLQTMFAAELIWPSRRLWLLFGWISDIAILDNSARQFSALQPDWPSNEIRLSSILKALVDRGGDVVLILRDVKHNYEFIDRLSAIRQKYPGRLRVKLSADVHDKGILSDDFLISGSMNLTFNGVTVNDEHLTLRTDPASIEEWRMTLEQKWKDVLE